MRHSARCGGATRDDPPGFVRTKLSDLVALLSAFVAIVVTIALTALGNNSVMKHVLRLVWHCRMFRAVSLAVAGGLALVSVLVSWLLFTWIIARLPRESVSFRSACAGRADRRGGFEIFKQVASIYLQSVVTGPAGATFGPVLGLMVFAYITARLILFATAWAATSPENMGEDRSSRPDPADHPRRVIPARGSRPSRGARRPPRWGRLVRWVFRGSIRRQ